MSKTPFGIPSNAPDLAAAIAVETKAVAWIDAETYQDLLEDAPWAAGAIGEFSQRQKDQYTVPLFTSPQPLLDAPRVTDEVIWAAHDKIWDTRSAMQFSAAKEAVEAALSALQSGDTQ